MNICLFGLVFLTVDPLLYFMVFILSFIEKGKFFDEFEARQSEIDAQLMECYSWSA